jgi:hypothetical protein
MSSTSIWKLSTELDPLTGLLDSALALRSLRLGFQGLRCCEFALRVKLGV